MITHHCTGVRWLYMIRKHEPIGNKTHFKSHFDTSMHHQSTVEHKHTGNNGTLMDTIKWWFQHQCGCRVFVLKAWSSPPNLKQLESPRSVCGTFTQACFKKTGTQRRKVEEALSLAATSWLQQYSDKCKDAGQHSTVLCTHWFWAPVESATAPAALVAWDTPRNTHSLDPVNPLRVN